MNEAQRFVEAHTGIVRQCDATDRALKAKADQSFKQFEIQRSPESTPEPFRCQIVLSTV